MLTKEELFAVKTGRRIKTYTVPHPSGEGTTEVRFRSLYLSEIEKLQELAQKDQKVADTFGSRLIALCWVDGQGKRILADDDINSEAWRKQDPRFLLPMMTTVRAHCGLNGIVTFEEEIKNSPATDDGFLLDE